MDKDGNRRKWDPLVKLTHWTIVAAVLVNAAITEEGSAAHVWIGYGLGAILALRLLWGLIGPREARFSAFPPSPARAIEHLRDIRAGRPGEHLSHNPLGALMVYAIWGTLAAIVATGIAMAGIPDIDRGISARGPEVETHPIRAVREDAGEDEDGEREDKGHEDGEGLLGEMHETAVNLLYFLILLHLAGVAFETRRSGRHILVAMLPGRR